MPCRDHPSFTNSGPSGAEFQHAFNFGEVNDDRDTLALGVRFLVALRRILKDALALCFVRRDARATMKLEHRHGRGTIHHGDLGIVFDRLKAQQVWAIGFWLDRERRLRDRAMFDLAIDSKLRGCDVVKIKIGELVSGGPGSLSSFRRSR